MKASMAADDVERLHIVDQRVLIALEVAELIAAVPLKTFDAGHLTQGLALRPAAQGHKLAPASLPAPVPQAPPGTLQSANYLSGQRRVGGACAKASGGLQHMLEAHRGVLSVEHQAHAETACLDDSVAPNSVPR